MELSDKCVRLWAIDLDSVAADPEVLSVHELERAGKYRFDIDRRRFVARRTVLRQILANYIPNCLPGDINFGYSKYEKPFAKDHPDLKFNISHSSGRAIVAVAKSVELGVDIECIKPIPEMWLIANGHFSKGECERLSRVPEALQRRAFFECWTRKEAFIKAEGSGLSFPLGQFEVAFGENVEASLLSTAFKQDEKEHWTLYAFEPFPDYPAAIALRQTGLSFEHYLWDTQ